MNYKDYKKIQSSIPRSPGVYRFIGANEEILYVGKAKQLHKRVASYFNSDKQKAYKTKRMVFHAERIEFTVVDNENDAFLLENSLIKAYQPRYNIMLRDDKTYTYICVKNEHFPRVFFTRKRIQDGSKYFGPYTSKFKASTVLDLIKKLYPIRTCKLNLAPKQIAKNNYKLCLEYHIGNCLGPCVGLETEANYDQRIEQIVHILNGRLSVLKRRLKEDMQVAADKMQYEKAHQLKEKLSWLDEFYSKSTVYMTSMQDLDVFAVASEDKYHFINYLKVVEGRVVHTFSSEIKNALGEEIQTLLPQAIYQILDNSTSEAEEWVVPFEIENWNPEVKITVPQRGPKAQLLKLAEMNARLYAKNKAKHRAKVAQGKNSGLRIMKTLQSDLSMDQLPSWIECFDNSNLQGSHPVASCVVFKEAKPSKKDYRHFNIKTVIGANDFESMAEVVFRRYHRLKEEGNAFPQLVVIDGGKGQLSFAYRALVQLGLQDEIKVIGIAKRLEEIFIPNDSIPIYIDKKSESLKLIQQLRNEAHRFAVSFHRTKRSENFTRSELEDINGIGQKTTEFLLSTFGSIKTIKELPLKTLEDAIGKSKAHVIYEYFHPEN